MIETSPAHSVLQELILPEDMLLEAEEQYPGLIRLRLATRNHARLLVDGEAWNFFLEESQADEAKLQLEERLYNQRGQLDPVLWDYVWHRVAEAILAVRQGHREHRRRMALRRKKKNVPKDGT